MSIVKRGSEKENYSIAIDLKSIAIVNDLNIKFHPCRLKAVNNLYEKGQKIIIFTDILEENEKFVKEQISDLKYHQIVFNIFKDVDFIVSSNSRENISFFNEVFDRNYEIKPLPYLISYEYFG
tara:strand:+ start:186 stop:554 length:369 start_codon:yes stop_codon:yes gene_type:complete